MFAVNSYSVSDEATLWFIAYHERGSSIFSAIATYLRAEHRLSEISKRLRKAHRSQSSFLAGKATGMDTQLGLMSRQFVDHLMTEKEYFDWIKEEVRKANQYSDNAEIQYPP